MDGPSPIRREHLMGHVAHAALRGFCKRLIKKGSRGV